MKILIMKKPLTKSTMREETLHQTFIKILMKVSITKVKFSGKRVSLNFFGHRISDQFTIKKEDHVAEWSRRRKEIFIDKNFSEEEREKSFKALCVHEVIEKFLVEKFGLKLDKEAHSIATQKEKEYLKKIGGNWRNHELEVFWDWHKLGEH